MLQVVNVVPAECTKDSIISDVPFESSCVMLSITCYNTINRVTIATSHAVQLITYIKWTVSFAMIFASLSMYVMSHNIIQYMV